MVRNGNLGIVTCDLLSRLLGEISRLAIVAPDAIFSFYRFIDLVKKKKRHPLETRFENGATSEGEPRASGDDTAFRLSNLYTTCRHSCLLRRELPTIVLHVAMGDLASQRLQTYSNSRR